MKKWIIIMFCILIGLGFLVAQVVIEPTLGETFSWNISMRDYPGLSFISTCSFIEGKYVETFQCEHDVPTGLDKEKKLIYTHYVVQCHELYVDEKELLTNPPELDNTKIIPTLKPVEEKPKEIVEFDRFESQELEEFVCYETKFDEEKIEYSIGYDCYSKLKIRGEELFHCVITDENEVGITPSL